MFFIYVTYLYIYIYIYIYVYIIQLYLQLYSFFSRSFIVVSLFDCWLQGTLKNLCIVWWNFFIWHVLCFLSSSVSGNFSFPPYCFRKTLMKCHPHTSRIAFVYNVSFKNSMLIALLYSICLRSYPKAHTKICAIYMLKILKE